MKTRSVVCTDNKWFVQTENGLVVRMDNDSVVRTDDGSVVETNDDEATVRLDLPKHIIASRLSITPETLSRLLRAMADDGILTVDDRLIFVHSLARLRPYD